MAFILIAAKSPVYVRAAKCITTEGTFEFKDCIVVQPEKSNTVTIIERPQMPPTRLESDTAASAIPSRTHFIGLEFCVKMTLERDLEAVVLMDETHTLWRLASDPMLAGEESPGAE